MANPNTIYSAETLASTAMALVEGDLGLGRTVSRSFEAQFAGKVGYSVNVERPAVLASRTRALTSGQATAITSDALAQSVQAITLDTEVYSAVDLSDAELTLAIEDFAAEVTKPQTDAIVHGIEAQVVAALEGVSPTIDMDLTTGGDTTKASLLAAFSSVRSTFRKNDVPMSSLYAVCGVDAYSALLDLDLVKVDGQAGTGTEAPNVRGFRVMEHNGITDDSIIFYHPAAFHLALRAPVVPAGVSFGASLADRGVAMRVIRDYNSVNLTDRQVLNTYVGVDALGVVKQSDGTVYQPVLVANPSVV